MIAVHREAEVEVEVEAEAEAAAEVEACEEIEGVISFPFFPLEYRSLNMLFLHPKSLLFLYAVNH